MWYNLLKSGQKQTAYRLFRSAVIHRREFVFSPKNPELIMDEQHLFHPNTEYLVLKTTTPNETYTIYYHPDYARPRIISNNPAHARYTEYIEGMFAQEYPEFYKEMMMLISRAYITAMKERKDPIPNDSMRSNEIQAGYAALSFAVKKIIRMFNRYIGVLVSETVRHQNQTLAVRLSTPITASGRRLIRQELLASIPTPKQALSGMSPNKYNNDIRFHIHNIYGLYLENLRKTDYIWEHIANLLYPLRDLLNEKTGLPKNINAKVSREEYLEGITNIRNLPLEEPTELVYTVIVTEPQDVTLFLDYILADKKIGR